MKTTRVLLCDRRTGLFVQSPDRWTRRADSAHDFQQVADAMRFVRDWGLNAVELVVSFEQAEYDVRVPVAGNTNHPWY
jgi:hypothetical protein